MTRWNRCLGARCFTKRPALRAGRIPKSQSRRIAMIDDHHALEPATHWRKLIDAGDRLRRELASAGDLQLMARSGAEEPLTRGVAHLRDLRELERVLLGRREDRTGQRML